MPTKAVTPKTEAQITVVGNVGPTRRGVEALLREFTRWRPDDDDACEKLRRVHDDLRDRLLDVPEMREAKRNMDEAYSARRQRIKETVQAAERVRLLYYARGLTPKVVEAVQALVEKYGV